MLSLHVVVAVWVLASTSDAQNYIYSRQFDYPIGNSTFALGDSVNITWSQTKSLDSVETSIVDLEEKLKVKLDLYDDIDMSTPLVLNRNLTDVFDQSASGSGSYTWSFPLDLRVGQYHMRLSFFDDNRYYGSKSSGTFNLTKSGDCPVFWDSGSHGPCIGPKKTTSQITSDATQDPTPPPFNSSPQKSTKGRNAGIGAGVALFVLCVALGWWLIHRRRKQPAAKAEDCVSADGGWGQGIEVKEQSAIDTAHVPKGGDSISADGGWGQGIAVDRGSGIDTGHRKKVGNVPINVAEMEGQSYSAV